MKLPITNFCFQFFIYSICLGHDGGDQEKRNAAKFKEGSDLDKYIVLTNKDTFKTILKNDGFEPVETYDFYFFENLKASYTIAKVLDENTKIQLIEEFEAKEYINNIGVKFFEKFETIEAAREELHEIVKASGNSEDSINSKLVKSKLPV